MKRIKFSNTTKVTPFAPLRLTYFCLLKKNRKLNLSMTYPLRIHRRCITGP